MDAAGAESAAPGASWIDGFYEMAEFDWSPEMTITAIKRALRRAAQWYPEHRANRRKLALAYLNPPRGGYVIDGAPGWRARGRV